MVKFELAPDLRTADCAHAIYAGCQHCCIHCDTGRHICGGCGDPLEHQGPERQGTCGDCHRLYMTDGI